MYVCYTVYVPTARWWSVQKLPCVSVTPCVFPQPAGEGVYKNDHVCLLHRVCFHSPLVKVCNNLLVMGLLDDDDLHHLLCLLAPAAFDQDHSRSESRVMLGIV